MSAPLLEALEMEQETEKSADSPAHNDESDSIEKADATEEFSSELEIPGWSIVTFEGVAVSGLDYAEALKWLQKLHEQKVSGLCIVTDEAAARISK